MDFVMIGISRGDLATFASLPDHGSVTADEVPGVSRTAVIPHLRRLGDLDLVDVTTKRPLRVQLQRSEFPLALHGVLISQPHFRPLLTGTGLPIIAVLCDGAKTVQEIAYQSDLHPNTVRNELKKLGDRALITHPEHGHYGLAVHAHHLAILGRLHARHATTRKMAKMHGSLTIRAETPLYRIVESTRANAGCPLTAVSRFQKEGADVMAARNQYRVHAYRDKDVSLEEAYQDARLIVTPPRTLVAMKEYLRRTE